MIVALYLPSYAKFRARLWDPPPPSEILGAVEAFRTNRTDDTPHHEELEKLWLSLRSFTAIVRDDDRRLSDDDCLAGWPSITRESSSTRFSQTRVYMRKYVRRYPSILSLTSLTTIAGGRAGDVLHACAGRRLKSRYKSRSRTTDLVGRSTDGVLRL